MFDDLYIRCVNPLLRPLRIARRFLWTWWDRWNRYGALCRSQANLVAPSVVKLTSLGSGSCKRCRWQEIQVIGWSQDDPRCMTSHFSSIFLTDLAGFIFLLTYDFHDLLLLIVPERQEGHPGLQFDCQWFLPGTWSIATSADGRQNRGYRGGGGVVFFWDACPSTGYTVYQ